MCSPGAAASLLAYRRTIRDVTLLSNKQLCGQVKLIPNARHPPPMAQRSHVDIFWPPPGTARLTLDRTISTFSACSPQPLGASVWTQARGPAVHVRPNSV